MTYYKHVLRSFFVLAACVLIACSEKEDVSLQRGTFFLHLDTENKITVETATRAELPTLDNYAIKILNADGSIYTSWESYADMPNPMTLDVGTFSLNASYGNSDSEGFDLTDAGFSGSQTFEITNNGKTQVDVTCHRAQTLITLSYSDLFKKYFTDYSASLRSGDGNFLLYAKDETRTAYLKPGDISASWILTKQDGTTVNLNKTLISDAQAGTQYNIIVDISVGGSALNIIFNNCLILDTLTFDIRDDEMRSLPPSFTPTGYTHQTPVTVLEGDTYQGSLMALLSAQGGIASCTLTTQSASLLNAGFPASIDLCTADGANSVLMKDLGLSIYGLQGTTGKMAVVDFSGLTESLMISDSQPEHTFTLIASDSYGRESEPLTLKISNLPFNMNLNPLAAQPLGNEATNIKISLPEGSDASHIQFWTKNDAGDFTSMQSSLITSSGNDYTFSVPLTIGLAPSTLKATYNKMSSNEITVSPDLENIPFALECLETNSWAKHALLDISAEKAIQLTGALQNLSHVYTKTTNGDWTEATFSITTDNQLKITSLQPNTDYEVRGTCARTVQSPLYSSSATLHTEKAMQVENSGFETWEKTFLRQNTIFLSGGEKIYTYTPYASSDSDPWWESLNAYTTQHPESGSYASWYYVSYPGVVSTPGDHDATDYWLGKSANAHSGNYAAEISTVGWGGNNWSAISKKASRVTAGQLFIGKLSSFSWDDGYETTLGHEFQSRPLKMTFYYRFAPYNSESAQASIVIKNVKGETIGSGSVDISSATDSWTACSVNIAYSKTNEKANSMYIIFLSSTADSPQTNPYEKGKAINNGYGQSRHIGNVLSVDDVELIYE